MANEVVRFQLSGVTEALANQHVIVIDTDSNDTVLMNNRTMNIDSEGNVELDVSSTGKSSGDKVRIFGSDYPSKGNNQKGFNYVGTVEINTDQTVTDDTYTTWLINEDNLIINNEQVISEE